MGGLGAASANAQAPIFSPPSLPSIPGAPQAPIPQAAAPAAVTPPSQSQSTTPPPLPDMVAVEKSEATIQPPTSGAALSDLPAPVSPEAGDVVKNDSAPPPPLGGIPGLQLAPPPLSPQPSLAGNIPILPMPNALSLMAPKATEEVAEAAPKVKSWKTTLASTATLPKLGYHYKRVLLPGAIYRTQYDRDNSHLPMRITRDDYSRLLVASAAQNDVNATRALLNAGAGSGAAALNAAHRAQAMDTAALLEARGAR